MKEVTGALYASCVAAIFCFVAALMGFDPLGCAIGLMISCIAIIILASIKPHAPTTLFDILDRDDGVISPADNPHRVICARPVIQAPITTTAKKLAGRQRAALELMQEKGTYMPNKLWTSLERNSDKSHVIAEAKKALEPKHPATVTKLYASQR